MVDGVGFGTGLGLALAGGVQQQNVQAQRDIQTRALELQERQFQSQQLAEQQGQALKVAKDLTDSFVKMKQNSGLSNAQFEERTRQSIEQTAASLTRTSQLAQANGINVPDLGQQFLQAVQATNTATEQAAVEGQAAGTGRIAEAQTLTEFGIPTVQALEAAGVPSAQAPQLQTEIGKLISDQQ